MQQEDNPNQSPQIPPSPIVNQPVTATVSQQPLENQQAQIPPVVPPVYAGFWVRYAALAIDGFFYGIMGAIVGGLFGVLKFPAIVVLLVRVVLIVIYNVFFITKYGASPGEKALNLKIIDSAGNIPTVKKAILREVVGKLASTIPINLGYVWVAFDKEKQGFHDKIASTHVVITKPLSGLQKVFVYFVSIPINLAILGILAAAVLIAINPVARQAQARDVARKSDVGQIRLAAQSYYAGVGHGKYPASLEDLVTSGDLKQPPSDPKGGQYYYQVSADNHSFAVYANLESGKKGVWCETSSPDVGVELSSASECVPK